MSAEYVPLTFEDDEAAHPIGETADWRESYYCNFFDTESDLYGLAWQGVRPNAGKGEAAFVLFDGDDAIVRSVGFDVPVASDIGPERNALGNQEFVCVEPWNRWRVDYADGDDRVSVNWEQLSEICDWDWEGTNSKHYQGAGRISVEGNVGGREIAFSGFGERDRAWGPRNYTKTLFTWWQTVQFPDATALHVFTQLLPDGSHDAQRLAGYLHIDGRTRPLREARFDGVEYDGDEGAPIACRQTFVDDEGRELRIKQIQPLHALEFIAKGPQMLDRKPEPGEEVTMMHFTFHRFVREDGALGRGMIDCPRRADERPTAFVAKGEIFSRLYDFTRESA